MSSFLRARRKSIRWIFGGTCFFSLLMAAASAIDLTFGLGWGYDKDDLRAALIVLVGSIGIYFAAIAVVEFVERAR